MLYQQTEQLEKDLLFWNRMKPLDNISQKKNRPCGLVSCLMFRLDEIFLYTNSIISRFSTTIVKSVLYIQSDHIIFPSYHILNVVREYLFLCRCLNLAINT